MTYRAVIFDLGGVVLGSPLHAIADYERELGLEPDFVNRVVADTAPDGAWARLERGELHLEEFYEAFEADCRDAGQEISARIMMTRMGEAARPRPSMLEAIGRIRRHGLSVAALTNNWVPAAREEKTRNVAAISEIFDVFVESSVEGLRKPDPRIYTLTCERLGVEARETVFLDDIGRNLKPARSLGLTTVKVTSAEQGLDDLGQLLGLALRG